MRQGEKDGTSPEKLAFPHGEWWVRTRVHQRTNNSLVGDDRRNSGLESTLNTK